MNPHPITRLAWPLAAAGMLLLTGCSSTPQHTNVLVFGTTTRLALDVSQDATSGVGITLGYKRQEAVWMPLLPNQPASGNTAAGPLQPATCTNSDCPKFEGKNGEAQKDTYSVLASFGSKLGGGVDAQGKDAKAQAEIAQYFATGLAARALAQSGAALVSTQAAALTPAQMAALNRLSSIAQSEQDLVIDTVKDDKDPAKVNAAKMAALIAKAVGPDALSTGAKLRIGSALTTAELRELLIVYDIDAARLAKLAKSN